MLFAAGLYVGGGGNIATQSMVRGAINGLRTQLETELDQLQESLKALIAGTAQRLRNNILETLVGPGRWNYSSMNNW